MRSLLSAFKKKSPITLSIFTLISLSNQTKILVCTWLLATLLLVIQFSFHEKPTTQELVLFENLFFGTWQKAPSFVYDKSEGWYDAKHQSFSIDEIVLVNSFEVKQCPYCHSETIRKERKRKDITQRYTTFPAEEDSIRWQEVFSISGRFRWLNGLNS